MKAPVTWTDWLKYIVAFVLIVFLVYEALLLMDAYTPEAFSLTAAFLIAAVFERFGWIKEAWDKLTVETKQLVMWLFLAILVFGAFGLSCANVMPAFQCTWPDGFMQAAMTFLLTAGVNQGTHRLLRKKFGKLPSG
jgi:hypothetical protein